MKLNKNNIYVYFDHFLNLVYPLLSVVYLTIQIDIELWGEVAYGISLCQIAVVLIDYGLHVSAARDISSESRNRSKYKIIGHFYLIKTVIFFVLSVLVFLLNFMFFERSSFDVGIFVFYLFSLSMVSTTIFLSLDRFESYFLINVFSKIVGILFLFLVIDGDSTLFFVVLSLSVPYFLLVILSFLYLIRKNLIVFDCKNTLKYFVSSGRFFKIHLAGSIATLLPFPLFGYAFDDQAKGVYALVERVFRSLSGLFSPLRMILIKSVSSGQYEFSAAELYKYVYVGFFVFSIQILVGFFFKFFPISEVYYYSYKYVIISAIIPLMISLESYFLVGYLVGQVRDRVGIWISISGVFALLLAWFVFESNILSLIVSQIASLGVVVLLAGYYYWSKEWKSLQ